MIRPIVIYGDDTLRNKVVEPITDLEEAKEIAKDLHDTLATTTGCGLACPQIGMAKNAFLVKYQTVDKVFFNVEILSHGEEMVSENEGCLSIPDIREAVQRPNSIVVKYQDESLEEYVEEFSGFVARIIQHEYDHLCGEMFIDKIGRVRAHAIRKDLEKISKGHYLVKYKTNKK